MPQPHFTTNIMYDDDVKSQKDGTKGISSDDLRDIGSKPGNSV